MKATLIIQLIFFISINTTIGQSTDTIQFEGFKGIICDSVITPFGSRNIFPKNRFNPTIEDVQKVESELIRQYGKAFKKHHELFYKENKSDKIGNLTEEEKQSLEQIIRYKERGDKSAKKAIYRIRKEYKDYDRKYYGYIGLNEMRYIRIEFTPHKERWIEIPGAGESQIYNLPILVYNLSNDKLSLAGWTGENDE